MESSSLAIGISEPPSGNEVELEVEQPFSNVLQSECDLPRTLCKRWRWFGSPGIPNFISASHLEGQFPLSKYWPYVRERLKCKSGEIFFDKCGAASQPKSPNFPLRKSSQCQHANTFSLTLVAPNQNNARHLLTKSWVGTGRA